MIANTPEPPYYAVIFTSIRSEGDKGYNETAKRMLELVASQSGFLGMESGHDETSNITVCYWDSLEAIKRFKENTEHLAAQQTGKSTWYEQYKTRICKVERDYGFPSL